MLARIKPLRFQLGLAAAYLGLIGFAVGSSSAAQVIPVPRVLVMVHTVSGSVVRDTPVPLGGAPVPIDVDNGKLLGLLCPDIDVSVGLIAADELPGKPLVPNIIVRRDPLAVTRNAPAPNFSINTRIVIDDIGNNKVLATIDYGFSTPPGAKMPPEVRAKLLGPITSGFVDPLVAKLETPGYAGPLDFKITADTETFKGDFGVKFDPIPEAVTITEDPRDDGLDFTYDHVGSVADVQLDATADLLNKADANHLRHIHANVERLPNHLQLSNTNTANTTLIDYQSRSQTAKADLEADYQDTLGNGTIVTDANVKVTGLPSHMTGKIDTSPTPDGGAELDGIDFNVLDGQEIDAVDFLARNYTGVSGVVPEVKIGPDPMVAVAQRQVGGTARFRAAGHLEAIRGGTFKRLGDDKDKLDVDTNLGDGTKPLRAILDMDNRGAPPADSPKHLTVDATVTPLPRHIHALFEPSTGSDPLHLLYESSNPVDIDANVAIATGPADACGSDDVICALARVDKIPPFMDVKLPGEGGTDFSLSHHGNASLRPDVRATIDVGPSTATDPKGSRTWVNAQLLRIPNEVTGRLDAAGGALRAAEFHGCVFDFASSPPKCDATKPIGAIGRVGFTVRDQPSRVGLPPRPDVASQFVTLISRHKAPAVKRFEVNGRVDEVRNVVFHQLDRVPGDDKTDGVLGALVDVGVGGDPFDLVIDSADDALGDKDHNPVTPDVIIGDAKSDIAVNVASLPRTFSACVRNTEEVPAPNPGSLPTDALLAPCERTDVVSKDSGEHDVTPLSANYTAVDQNGNPSPTKVTANVKSTAPSLDDLNGSGNPIDATSLLNLAIDKVPGSLRADVIPPITPAPGVPGRKLKLVYDASQKIGKIDFALENRRASSICEDPRPNRKALCVSGTLNDLPDTVAATFDPDDEKGDIDFTTAAPAAGDPKLSIAPFHLSKVSPGPKDQPLVADATVEGITPHLVGKFVSKHTPSDPIGEKSLAALLFNACPSGSPASCTGIDKITFTATNALVGDPLPNAPAKDADTTQDFTFVQRGLDFRAKGEITKLKEIGLSKLKSDDTPSSTTKVRAAFGDGTSAEKLRAYIDRQTVSDPVANTGLEEQVVHAVIAEAPRAINLCFRDQLTPPNLPDTAGSAGFCDKAPADKLAVQARLDQSAGGAAPDIDIRKLHLAKGGGTDFLDGTVFIGNLAERIDVLAGKGDKTDIVVEGHDINDGPADAPKNVADRVRFNLRNYEGDDNGTGQFPFRSLSGAQDPESDPRVVQGSEKNFVKVIKDVNTLLLKGSIPDIKRVALQPGPCFASDPRTPDAGFPVDVRPDYTCVNLIAAQNRPLGLAIRTKDDKGEILSMDEGFIDSVPGGDGGIFATLGKSPAKAKLNPTCGDPGGTPAAGCKPTLLSVQALKANGQSTNLQARLATGPEGLVNDLKDVKPLDEYSKRLDYEAPVDSYDDDANAATADSKGVRVKLGTGKTGDAVRVGFNLDLPSYLDLDQPTSYSCKRDEIASGDVLSPDSQACKQSDVKAETNHGYESKDIAFRLVGSNTGHLGTDLASLGRVAVLIHSTDDGKQTILTGPTPANGANGTTGDDPEGSPPETAPAAGVWDLGINLPGYLDARVFIRSKYEAPDEDDVQTTYYQVDGRVNQPLSLNLRDVQSAALDGTQQTGRTRSGKDVAAMQLALRDAPGLDAAEAPDFSKPTFRVRAEIRKKHKEPDVGPYDCKGFNPGGGRTAGFGANFCLYVPGDHIEKWIDVGLNMSPPAGHARTVDVVMDSTDYTQVDMRASKLVDASGSGPVGKGPSGTFTSQAGLRLQPFPIGLEIGVGLGIVGGNTLLLLDGDLILKLTGRENSHLRLSQNKGKLRLLANGGPPTAASIKTHDQTVAVVQVRAEALFGLISENVVDVRTAPYHQPVEFKPCFPTLALLPLQGFDNFEVDPDDSTSAGIALTPGFLSAASGGTASAAEVLTGVSELLAPIWCFFSTSDSDLVTSSHPAPAFTEPGHEINGGGAAPPDAVVPQTTPAPQPGDLTVHSGDDVKLCGAVGFKSLVVESGGIIRAGTEGEVLHDVVDLDGPGGQPAQPVDTPCDGSLTISAESVDVQAGGVITATGVRTTAGPGAGNAPGGGASHAGTGGKGGGGGAASTVNYTGASETSDFGSRGGAGSGGADGGAGGGTLRVVATNDLRISGTVAANGAPGAANTADCVVDAAGGGSGGRVSLTANRVLVSGAVQARGGAGGTGGDAGGGGGGGRIAVNTVAPRPLNANLQVNGGAAGTNNGDAGCDLGDAGGPGNAGLGKTLSMGAGVSLDTSGETPPTYLKGDVPIKIKAVKSGGGPLRVIVCKRSVGPSSSDAFDDAALTPPVTLASAVGAAGCRTESFSDQTAAGGIYTRSIVFPALDGYHGFYAIAAEPPNDNLNDCQDVGFFNDNCDYQSDLASGDPVLPSAAQFKVATDNTGPALSFSDENGDAGCADGRKCLNQAGTMKVVSADGTGGVGLSAVQCSINGGLFDIPCGPGNTVSVDLGTTDGPADVRIKATDRLGNTTEIAGPRWFTDRTPGQTPVLTVTQTDADPTNGWFHSPPHVTVHAEDGAAGFVGKPVTFFTDTSSKQCGTISDKSVTFGPLTFDLPLLVDCFAAETDAWVPEEGIHTFQAQATDRLGNVSLKSNVGSMKVDKTPPTTQIFLGPKQPDGKAGWYVTRPFVAFRSVDTVGGSGVNLGDATHTSKIELNIDGDGWHTWDPNDPNELTDGIHEVCYRGTDVAGNTGTQGCRSTIKVDTTAPVATDVISPGTPNGSSDYYIAAKPSINPDASDPAAAGVQISGVAGKQYQVDDGPWTTAAPFLVDEGTHTVRVRAFDVAGNAATLTERTVNVDLSRPNARTGSYPAAANGQGWFRQPRVMSAAAHDGRDASGIASTTVSLDGGAAGAYAGPFAIGPGVHTTRVQTTDRAGLPSDPVDQTTKVDIVAPTAAPSPDHVSTLRLVKDLLGHLLPALSPATLKFTVTDDQPAAKVRVNVLLYNELEGLVKVLPAAAAYPGGFRDQGAGSVKWNGSGFDDLGVVPGIYHYRVQSTDQAGNTTLSTESPTFIVAVGLLPLLRNSAAGNDPVAAIADGAPAGAAVVDALAAATPVAGALRAIHIKGARIVGRSVRVTLACPADGPRCTGVLRVATTAKRRLGSVRYAVAASTRKTVALPITAAQRRLVRRAGTVVAQAAAGVVTTLTVR